MDLVLCPKCGKPMRDGQLVEEDFAGKPVQHVNADECEKASPLRQGE